MSDTAKELSIMRECYRTKENHRSNLQSVSTKAWKHTNMLVHEDTIMRLIIIIIN